MEAVPHVAVAPFTVVAPGRVNLIGEHTDYNDGFVLPLAIDRHVALRIRPRSDRLVVAGSGIEQEPVVFDPAAPVRPPVGTWSSYLFGVLAGYRGLGYDPPGFEAEITSTLPVGAGLSSSAALEVAIAVAVETLCGRAVAPLDRALLCQRAEHDYAGVPCGIMDQFAVCFGRAGHALLIDCRSRQVRHVPLDPAVRVLVFDSGVRHRLADGDYAVRREQCRQACVALGVASLRDLDGRHAETSLPAPLASRARHVVTENVRVAAFVAALAARDWVAAGRLMKESHRSLAVDYEVSCPELDTLVALADRLAGVFGCRMTGGGFGGCVVALVAADRAADAGRMLAQAYRGATGIDASWFITTAADGAAVVT